MSDHWTTPPRILRASRRRYGIKQERFAPPLNFDVEGGEYWSAHDRDIWGPLRRVLESVQWGKCIHEP